MMPQRVRIGILVDQLGEGGGQRSAIIVASQLHELGFPTQVLSGRDGPYAAELPRALPVQLLAPGWPNASSVVKLVINLCRESRRFRTNVIFANGFAIGRLALLLRAMSPVGLSRETRVVVVERSTLSVAIRDRFPNPLMRWMILRLTQWLYRRADAIVGVSDGVTRDLEHTLRLSSGSVTTIHNPINADRIDRAIEAAISHPLRCVFDALPRPIVITAGRLVRAKAHRDLLEAFACLPESQRGSLVILGEGPLRSDLEHQADQLGISDRVWMPGFVDNPWWFIARADVFALSSHWEGHPRAILEALACGVPIASTDCPSGPREILADATGARLTPVGDIRSLSRAIEALLTNTETVFAENLERYSPQKVALGYSNVAEKAFARSQPTAPGPP